MQGETVSNHAPGRETILSQGSFNFAGTRESPSKSRYQQGCQLPITSCAQSLVVESRKFIISTKPEILLMPFRGSSTARALDLFCSGYTPPPQELPNEKPHRREKQSIASQCPMIVSLGRSGIQDRARHGKGGGWQVEKEVINKLKTTKTQGGAQNPSTADGTGLLFANKV